MIYFLSNVYKWTLPLLTVQRSSVVFAIYLIRSADLFALMVAKKNMEGLQHSLSQTPRRLFNSGTFRCGVYYRTAFISYFHSQMRVYWRAAFKRGKETQQIIG